MRKLVVSLLIVIGVILMTAGPMACKPEPESITVGERGPYEDGLKAVKPEAVNIKR
jgi:hypothetical protein